MPWPPNVRQFGTRRADTHLLPELGVAIHGRSFATPAVTENLVLAYPAAHERLFNIGMLHTALAGRQGHADYAPCSLDDLRAKRYDYWALGHVHEQEVVCTDPYVVFPGNTQGRSVRETGPKGAVIVGVEDGSITSFERVETDVLRWASIEVDCTDAAIGDGPGRMRAALSSAWTENEARRPLVTRITLVGATDNAGSFLDRAASLRDDARAVAAAISPDLFIEKVRVRVAPPAGQAGVQIGDDLAALIAEVGTDPGLAAALAEDLEPFLVAARTSLDEPEPTELRGSAAAGDWQTVISNATLALRSRLTREQ